MATRLRFEVDVHLDFDDGNWTHAENPDISREDTVKLNVENIAEAIEDVINNEYGLPYVTVSARFKSAKEDS